MSKELSFEECLKELEEVVKQLENKDISLDLAVKNYQKGLELTKRAYDIFNKTQELVVKKVENNEITDFTSNE